MSEGVRGRYFVRSIVRRRCRRWRGEPPSDEIRRGDTTGSTRGDRQPSDRAAFHRDAIVGM